MKKTIVPAFIFISFYNCAFALTAKECEEKNGEVVNTLVGQSCEDGQNLGAIEGLRCPCVCCAPKDTEASPQWKLEKPNAEKSEAFQHEPQHKKVETH